MQGGAKFHAFLLIGCHNNNYLPPFQEALSYPLCQVYSLSGAIFLHLDFTVEEAEAPNPMPVNPGFDPDLWASVKI